jgi:hypothetical protein
MRVVSKVGSAIAVTVAALVVMGGFAAASPPPANSPWLETNYNAADSRANLAEATLTKSTIGGVALRRNVTAAGNPDSACEGFEGVVAPILSGGFAYGVFNGYLHKVNAGSGVVSWRVAPDTSFSTTYRSIVISGSLVIVAGQGCDSVSDPNGFIAAFQISNGAPAWSTGGGPLISMVSSRGYLLTVGESVGSGFNVRTLNAATGADVWSATGDPCTVPNAVVVGGLAIYSFCDFNDVQSLRGVALANGAPVWTKLGGWEPVAGDKSASSGTHVYAAKTSAGTVYDLNPATGATRTRIPGAKLILAVDGARVYATCGSVAGQVCGYSLSTGVQQWNVKTGSVVALGAFAGGVLYLSNGKALNASSGATIRSIWSGGAHSLLVGDGRIGAVVNAQKLSIYGLAGG